MKRKILIVVGVLTVGVLLFLVFGRQFYTKRFSPEQHVTLQDGKINATVFYNRPYKRGREIFGALVPFDKVWRTGANEATTFESENDLLVNGKPLKKGIYSLWTVPGKNSWKVIFNTTIPPWGVDYDGNPLRSEADDVLIVEVPVTVMENAVEQLTVDIVADGTNYALHLMWDVTKVSVPLALAGPQNGR